MTREDLNQGKEILKKIADLKETMRQIGEAECFGRLYDVQFIPKNVKAWKNFIDAELSVYETELVGLETEFEMLGK